MMVVLIRPGITVAREEYRSALHTPGYRFTPTDTAELAEKIKAAEAVLGFKPSVYVYGYLDTDGETGMWIHGGRSVKKLGAKYLHVYADGEMVRCLLTPETRVVIRGQIDPL